MPPRERVRAILGYMDRFDNTAQYGWFLEIARTFLGFQGDRVTAADCDWLCDTAERIFAQPDWEEQVFRRTNLESIFLTNEFDDPLTGFDTKRYVPCLRTDALVFQLHQSMCGSDWRRRPGSRSAIFRLWNMRCGTCSSISRPGGAGLRHFAAARL